MDQINRPSAAFDDAKAFALSVHWNLSDFRFLMRCFHVSLFPWLFPSVHRTLFFLCAQYQLSPDPFDSDNVLTATPYILCRILQWGADTRFDETRENFWKFAAFWVFQVRSLRLISCSVYFVLRPIWSDLRTFQRVRNSRDLVAARLSGT